MKLFLPVAGIIGAIGACCCGDMDELTQKLQEIEATEAPVEAESEKPADGAPSAAPAVAGPALEGACGRFKDWGLPGPSGFKMLYCADADGTGSVTMQGSGSPAEACAPLKDWAAGIGAKLTLEATMMGVTAVYEKDAATLTINCMDVAGQINASVTLTAK